VITIFASLLSHFDIARFVRFAGRNSIVLYLSFTVPMMITRIALHKLGLIADPGWAALTVWLVAVTTPLAVYLVLKRTPLKYLYVRPSWFAISYTPNLPAATRNNSGAGRAEHMNAVRLQAE
jgi:uncharacterized membrane protein YcfT